MRSNGRSPAAFTRPVVTTTIIIALMLYLAWISVDNTSSSIGVSLSGKTTWNNLTGEEEIIQDDGIVDIDGNTDDDEEEQSDDEKPTSTNSPSYLDEEQRDDEKPTTTNSPTYPLVYVPSYDCSGRFNVPGSLPKFFVAGVHKGGSTSLFNYLAQHHDIKPAVCKEIHFFDDERSYAKGLTFYRKHFPNIHARINSSIPARITGEGSPGYIRYPLAPRRIKSCCPQAKIVIALRDPADRFESSWIGLHDRNMPPLGRMTCRQAWEASKSQWDRCLALGDDMPTCSVLFHENFIVRSIYSYQIERWLSLGYNSSNFLVIQSEHLFGKRTHTMQRVAEFLGLRPFSQGELVSFTQTFEGSSHLKESIAHDCDAVKTDMNTFFKALNVDLFSMMKERLPDSWQEFDVQLWDHGV